MADAVIVSTARTPLCKSWKGAFNITHGATMGGHALRHAIERAARSGRVEDVIMGCANPEGATGRNIARQIAIRGGCPVSTSGMTVNRFCSSGLQTIAIAAQRVISGEATSSPPARRIDLVRPERDEQAHAERGLDPRQQARALLADAPDRRVSPRNTPSPRAAGPVRRPQPAARRGARGGRSTTRSPMATTMKVVDKATARSRPGGHGLTG